MCCHFSQVTEYHMQLKKKPLKKTYNKRIYKAFIERNLKEG
jgi:hypothetical protein